MPTFVKGLNFELFVLLNFELLKYGNAICMFLGGFAGGGNFCPS